MEDNENQHRDENGPVFTFLEDLLKAQRNSPFIQSTDQPVLHARGRRMPAILQACFT